jgi:hypothetical protein
LVNGFTVRYLDQVRAIRLQYGEIRQAAGMADGQRQFGTVRVRIQIASPKIGGLK